MIDMKAFRAMALSFPHTEQVPHFERIGFKITGRRMFTTYLEKNNTANVFLTPAEQKLFCKIDKTNIYPNPTTGIVNVQFAAIKAGRYTIEVYDMHSRVVKKAEINVTAGKNNTKMDLKNLSKGSYLVKISGDSSITTEKILLER